MPKSSGAVKAKLMAMAKGKKRGGGKKGAGSVAKGQHFGQGKY